MKQDKQIAKLNQLKTKEKRLSHTISELNHRGCREIVEIEFVRQGIDNFSIHKDSLLSKNTINRMENSLSNILEIELDTVKQKIRTLIKEMKEND